MNNRIKTAFETLGCNCSSSYEECKQAYRDLVQVWHPDKYAKNNRLYIKATEETKQINNAWSTVLAQRE